MADKTFLQKKVRLKRSSHGKKAKLFRFLSKTKRKGPLSLVPVVVEGQELGNRRLSDSCIVTVPKVCGTAVKRNRFRRIVREYARSQHPDLLRRKTLWLRLSRDFRLPRKITLREWRPTLEELFQTD